jgi:hypothetical protein
MLHCTTPVSTVWFDTPDLWHETACFKLAICLMHGRGQKAEIA